MKDTQDRNTARRDLKQNIVVEAGAGTGKTTLLTDRLLFSLLAGGPKNEGIEISRLIALTFTEKAAGEIKLRLTSRLNDLAAVIDGRPVPEKREDMAKSWLDEIQKHFHRTPGQVRKTTEKAIHEMDRAEIGTIHHFASRLLRLYPVESGVDPFFEVDQGASFRGLFEAEWARWLDGELGTAAPRAEKWLEVLSVVPLEDIALLAEAFCQDRAAENSSGLTTVLEDTLRGFAERFASLPEGQPPPRGNSKILETIDEVAARLKQLGSKKGDTGEITPAFLSASLFDKNVSQWPKGWDEKRRELYEDGVSLAKRTSGAADVLVRKAAELVRPFAASFRSRYARAGWMTFDGLITKARALVRDNGGVRQELKARYDMILIDEFQDTDPVQGEILLFLAERKGSEARCWPDIRFDAGKIFVVGDPKQSIYRFRGADMRAYQKFTQLILDQGGIRCHLQTNFRSSAGLVEPVNHVFSQVMREQEGRQAGYKPIFPRPEPEHQPLSEKTTNPPSSGTAGVELVLTHAGDPADELKTRDSQALEAQWIAGWIRKNCSADPDKGPFHFKDVAVLLRSTTALSVYLDVFRESGFRYVVENDRYFYGTQEVTDFLNLLRALDDPHDRIALLGLLRSPLAALEDREIYELGAGGLNYENSSVDWSGVSKGGRSQAEEFYAFLRRMRPFVGREPLGDFMARLLRESYLLELCSAAYHHEQTLSNLMKFGRLAAEAGDGRGATLKEFIADVARFADESSEEGESPLADEQFDAVRIMTIHKSKGLEYPVVFIPGVGSGSRGRGSDKPVSRVDWSEGVLGLRLPQTKAADAAMALIELAEQKRESAERVRLFYVGMTRAREKLFLLGNATRQGKESFASMLAAAGVWPDEGERPSGILLDDGFSIPVHHLEKPSLEKFRVFRPHGSPRALDGEKLAALWLKRWNLRDQWARAPVFDTPTRTLSEEVKPDVVGGGGSRILSGEPALMGQICHRVLEGWDYRSGRNLPDGVKRACESLRRQTPSADWDRVEKDSLETLTIFLKSDAARRLADAEILEREMPFVYSDGGTVIRGSVDLLCRRAGRLWVADYKTDRISEPEMETHARRYVRQGKMYCEAVRRVLGEDCAFEVIFLRNGKSVEVTESASSSQRFEDERAARRPPSSSSQR